MYIYVFYNESFLIENEIIIFLKLNRILEIEIVYISFVKCKVELI